ncbi:hypothetical protein [Saccharothrix coeruleofusca]|uniref:Uncharacterized protein n=1 Tax=Saccharothrix coeruleofusca TaxID=33919 RepID=A0A918EFM6_9PSEU|nr:hypothetical protein [Saccharothrix coeruleofusca]MBP2337540.1 hypothetical protein [Saccharothrix coeruleofusca]GGP65129.1 hypothetical protein GCM10010185_42250 [Saccharothrix coeruleofusca]
MTDRVEVSGGFRQEDFEADGSLRDVCVLEAGLPVWERLVRAVVESSWEHQFEVDGEPRPLEEFSVSEFFASAEDQDVSARLAVRVGEVWFDCFFSDVEEVEFSFDPAEIADGERFGSLERFMVWLAGACDRRVVMTVETTRHDDIPVLLETRKVDG